MSARLRRRIWEITKTIERLQLEGMEAMRAMNLDTALLVTFQLLNLHHVQVCFHTLLAKHCSEP